MLILQNGTDLSVLKFTTKISRAYASSFNYGYKAIKSENNIPQTLEKYNNNLDDWHLYLSGDCFINTNYDFAKMCILSHESSLAIKNKNSLQAVFINTKHKLYKEFLSNWLELTEFLKNTFNDDQIFDILIRQYPKLSEHIHQYTNDILKIFIHEGTETKLVVDTSYLKETRFIVEGKK